MRISARTLVAVVASGAAVLAVLGGCEDGGGEPTGAATTTGGAPGPASPTAAAQSITATMTDYAIELSREPSAGAVTFVAEQAGQRPHALAIRGPGVDDATPGIQPGGASQRLAVTLQPGSYELWCPIGNHRALGMELTITVR